MITSAFRRTIESVHGPRGKTWLAQLPELVRTLGSRWRIEVQPPFPLSYHYVAPAARADGEAVVLKLGVPGDEFTREVQALRAFEGRGCVRLIEDDVLLGAMLLERALPGVPLAGVALQDDSRATSIAAAIMKRLWRPAPADAALPCISMFEADLGSLRARYGGGTGPLPPGAVGTAESIFKDLLNPGRPPVLLHGDLHHDNVLAAARAEWLVIDPKGCIGDPAYEAGSFLCNPGEQLSGRPDLARTLERRVDQLAAELGFGRRRIAAWGFVHAVLSACWSLEDHGGGWEHAICCAEALEPIL